MKSKVPYLIIVFLVIYLLIRFSGTSKDEMPGSMQFYPEYADSSLIRHTYYSLIYSEQHEQAEWVAYCIKPAYMESNFTRRDIFREDTLVLSFTASDRDYYKSGYDRGHLVPAGDMTFDSIALEESFYYSNISPQLAGFNRGIWRSLETHVRSLGEIYDSLFVFTGPVFFADILPIGDNDISVPDYFYKIIVMFMGGTISSASYLIPHQQGLPSYDDYRVSIDSIETLTSINFLHGLPPRLEKRLER